MNTYFVLKEQRNGNHSVRSAIVLDLRNNQKFCVTGNIPSLYHGMSVGFSIERREDMKSNYAVDYSIDFNDKNIAALEKAKVEVDTYRKTYELHQKFKADGLSWLAAESGVDNVYYNMPFQIADKIHKEVKNDSEAPERIAAFNKEIIARSRQHRRIGYTIEEFLSEFNDIEMDGAYAFLFTALKMACTKRGEYCFEDGKLWDLELRNKDKFVVSDIAERRSLSFPLLSIEEIEKYINEKADRMLEKEQLEVLYCLEDSSPIIVTGGAGTGKTSVVKSIIECYSTYCTRSEILLTAPTGKAARRLVEKTNMPASTIHRALRKNPEDDFVFYNERNKMPYKIAIIDESSMIDTELMYDLLKAADQNCKLIFVGDHNQLEPVGYGEPFFDFMELLPVYTLTINHRQSDGTDILANAERVLSTKSSRALTSGAGVEIRHLAHWTDAQYYIGDEENTQILSPYNSFNRYVNIFLRKDEGNKLYSIGDKVIMTKNTKKYCNGDIGRIVGKNSKEVLIRIEDKTVAVTLAHAKEDMQLAYALTIHKMQGSEADIIKVFLPEDKPIDWRMTYTAVTRARKRLEIYYYPSPELDEETAE